MNTKKMVLTCPHTSSPNPINTHHIHWSSSKGEQLKGFPPNCTITIYRRKEWNEICINYQSPKSYSCFFFQKITFLFLFSASLKKITPACFWTNKKELLISYSLYLHTELLCLKQILKINKTPRTMKETDPTTNPDV